MFLDGEEWRSTFRNIRFEAWRLETLPQYLVPQEAERFAAFKEGTLSGYSETSSDYIQEMRRQREEGKTKGRVHILSRPLSEYLRFEFTAYDVHWPAGDDIRILDITDRENPLPGVQDFWMFDRQTVVLMHYEEDGTQISRELYDGDPAPFIEYQRIALAESIPYPEYVKGVLRT